MRRVAITGFGVVSPIGVSLQEFWEGLQYARSGIGIISRFDCSTFAVKLAGEVKGELELPEAVSRIAIEDPKVGFAYVACTQALAAAGVKKLDSRIWLHLGTSLETFDLQKVVGNGRPDFRALAEQSLSSKTRPLQIPLDTAGELICDSFGRPGRLLTNCSACAAGAQAIGHSFRNIRSGRCEVAVCGGFDSMINPLGVGGFQLLEALTVDNHLGPRACQPFDASRTGTVLGEGAAVLVLESLEKARAEGKQILAELCGYGSTLDAHGLSAPDPEGSGAARSMLMAMEDAKIKAEQVSHINAHGTGTRLNDEIEAAAIRRVFKNSWERIPVSATKSVTGHLIGAAGALEAGACLLPLVKGVMPPNPCLEKVGPGCELAHITGNAIPFEGDYVLSNSFGFGGQNATLILRKYHG